MQTNLTMKRFLLTLLIAAFVVPAFSQSAAPVKKIEDYIKFKETKYNFGKIKQGVPVTHDFPFTIAGYSENIHERNIFNKERKSYCFFWLTKECEIDEVPRLSAN